ncbi:cytochrome C oxidase subunit IV family protein [Lutibacter flavus]|uniref:Cytochrome C oxidase subunit IV n=1 Tax=Lutibacter flavus TaxID=691689 RepID=A0A238ZIE2_9FLAO|nr:cytochrome C oxidase subunit IV family protein [Lutibacter flavus]SNR82768.1 Cytochrome C oxidase subunit IV [Lutibacter flavus]
MKKKHTPYPSQEGILSFLKVWIVLIVLTICTALIANSTLLYSSTVLLILILSVVKFLGVSFYFMELRKAHIFWKISVFMYALLFIVLVYVII